MSERTVPDPHAGPDGEGPAPGDVPATGEGGATGVGQPPSDGTRLGRRLVIGLGLAAVASVVVLVALLGGAGGSGPGGAAASPGPGSGATPPPVAVTDEVVADGIAVPRSRVELASETGGTVVTVPAALGDAVAAGDVLVTLDGSAIAFELERAEQAAAAAQARRAQAEALATQAEAQVDVAEANLDGAAAALATARDANRGEDEAVAARDAARAQVRVARAAASAAREAATAAAADEAAAASAVDAVRDRQSDRSITAPFAGIVASLPAAVGQVVQPGQVVARVADPSGWEFVATELDEGGLARVRVGAPATVVLDGLPGVTIPATVERVGSYGEARQGGIVYEVVVVPTSEVPDGVAWNMTATISIAAGE